MIEIRAVFLGAPGAGKGTQAKAVAEKHGTLHISSGDMLREHRQNGTDLGRQAEVFMNRGELVPDDLIVAMVMDRIQQPDARKSWILDGFPRTLPQARSLDQSLESGAAGEGLSHVVHFDVPSGVLVERLTGRRSCSGCGAIWHLQFKPTAVADVCDRCGGALVQRSDDREDVVTERLKQYQSLTEPLLDYYRGRGVLVDVDGDRPAEAVLVDLEQKLADREHSR